MGEQRPRPERKVRKGQLGGAAVSPAAHVLGEGDLPAPTLHLHIFPSPSFSNKRDTSSTATSKDRKDGSAGHLDHGGWKCGTPRPREEGDAGLLDHRKMEM